MVYTVDTVDTVDMVYTVDMEYTIHFYDSNGKFDSIRLVCVIAQQLHEVGIRRTSFFFCNNFKDRTKKYRHVGFVSGP